MIVLGLLFIFVSFCVGFSLLWLCGVFKVNNDELKDVSVEDLNPYIEAHQIRQLNDANYEKYLEWLDNNNHALPINKVKTIEELEFERKLNE